MPRSEALLARLALPWSKQRAVQLLSGQTKMDNTMRTLGVELEDALVIAEAIEI